MPDVLLLSGPSRRWSDIVLHNQTAYWVEVADDPTQDAAGQTRQILAQIEATLGRIGSQRSRLLQVLIYLADLSEAPAMNTAWDAWVPEGHAPVRACVQVGLAPPYRVEMVITAATGEADVGPS